MDWDRDLQKVEDGLVDGIFLREDDEDTTDDIQNEESVDQVAQQETQTENQQENVQGDVMEENKKENQEEQEDTSVVEEQKNDDVVEDTDVKTKSEEDAEKKDDDELDPELKAILDDIDASNKKVEDAKEDLKWASGEDVKKKLLELEEALEEKDYAISQFKMKSDFAQKKLDEEMQKRRELEFDTREAKDVYGKVSSSDALRSLVELNSEKDMDESAKERYLATLRDIYESETWIKISDLMQQRKENDKMALAESWWSVASWSDDSISDDWLENGIFLKE